uniref:Photolyase/cryptochrome alpha/beta domain-containing protein n=1 Tax=Nelumbo nucifera TaxID=4432 RepID=A0A822XHX7_NELNU|nr:TPA_asm: hypothetical protein HUJ06_020069 [Nelumbo nucifera]
MLKITSSSWSTQIELKRSTPSSCTLIPIMALLHFPRLLSFPSSFHSMPTRSVRCRIFSVAATPEGDTRRGANKKNDNDVALVWFKHDLRCDDHPGLVAASRHHTVVPLYIFDHRILSRLNDEMLGVVLLALEDLRKSLKDQGSNLMIRFGIAENVIGQLVNEVKASNVFVEEEVEYDLRRVINVVKDSVSSMSFTWGSPQFVIWQTPFYDIENLKELPLSNRDFRKLRLPVTAPVVSPSLTGINMELDWGTLPTFHEVKAFINGNPCKLDESWTSVKDISAKDILKRGKTNQSKMLNDPNGSLRNPYPSGNNQNNLNSWSTRRTENSVFISRNSNLIGGGTNSVLNALAAYLRYLEGTSRDDWQEVHDKLRNAESRSGASFVALFGPAICLGILSRRRIYHETIKYEKERNAGFLSPFGYSAATIATAVETVCSMEWYWILALKSQLNSEARYSIRIWRWNGHLIQYTVVGQQGPSVLLVHGFGAFLEHYRDNMHDIAHSGNRVWAITLLGFGKSEKPNLVYTELMWAELLRDFIVNVVGEPAHLIGNSIGGYFVSIVAALWPALVRSTVLINSAGSVIPGYSSIPVMEERRTSEAAWLGSQLLLLYLRWRVGDILKNCYPTNTERADDFLIEELTRAVSSLVAAILHFSSCLPILLHLSAQLHIMMVEIRQIISDLPYLTKKVTTECLVLAI